MNRRGFLRGLLGTAAVAATNPVHFLAPIGGWTSKTIINPNSYKSYIDWETLNPRCNAVLYNIKAPEPFYMHPLHYEKYIELTEEMPIAEAKRRFPMPKGY